mmetsp:Transcript_35519/g.70229  ORF Transcript_35519/g.70229 Transcript_35519/m.70229 type:complete len:277 (+) Transcript_35519:2977-3807(+)
MCSSSALDRDWSHSRTATCRRLWTAATSSERYSGRPSCKAFSAVSTLRVSSVVSVSTRSRSIAVLSTFAQPRTSSSCNRPTSCLISAFRMRSVASGMDVTSWTFNRRSWQAASTASSRELLFARSAQIEPSPQTNVPPAAPLLCVSSGEPSLSDPKSARGLAQVRVESPCVTSSRECVFRSVCSKRCSKRTDNNSERSSASPFLVVVAQCSSCVLISLIAASSCTELVARPASGRSGRVREAAEPAEFLGRALSEGRALGDGSERCAVAGRYGSMI